MVYYFFNKLKKILNKGYSSKGGRNIHGRICIRGQGAGNKRIYRFIDFFRRLNLRGRVINIIYDPNRTARLAVLIYVNSFSSYILLQKNVKFNSILYSGTLLCEEPLINGYSVMLQYIPLFSIISNIELKPFKGSTLCRAANTSCLLIGKIADKGILQLNSKWHLHISLQCIASMGTISNCLINNWFIDKAGKNRSLGWKPKVRGVAKNPCDHPHGGGNGKKSKPNIPVNAWHSVFKWKHTTNTKKDILRRRTFKFLNAS